MCGDDGGGGIEVTVRIDGSDDEITHAVVIDELEQRFTREADESLLQFQMRCLRLGSTARDFLANAERLISQLPSVARFRYASYSAF